MHAEKINSVRSVQVMKWAGYARGICEGMQPTTNIKWNTYFVIMKAQLNDTANRNQKAQTNVQGQCMC